MSEQALTPIEVRTIEFYGDTITGALVYGSNAAQVYVPIRPLCDYLGLDWSSQRQRLNRDEVLAEGVVIITIPSEGGPQKMVCLSLDLLPGWLFGITARRVKPAIKEKIARYRRECFRRLWEAFKHDILPAIEGTPPPSEHSGAELAYEIATAVQHLARQQMEFEQRLSGRIDTMARWARRTDDRLTAIEIRLDPADPIDERQAIELAGAVKAVAHALEQQGASSPYGQVYGQLYRMFAITSYKNLPRRRYQEALDWLRGWLSELDAEHGNP
jgi:hypothetical protein